MEKSRLEEEYKILVSGQLLSSFWARLLESPLFFLLHSSHVHYEAASRLHIICKEHPLLVDQLNRSL